MSKLSGLKEVLTRRALRFWSGFYGRAVGNNEKLISYRNNFGWSNHGKLLLFLKCRRVYE